IPYVRLNTDIPVFGVPDSVFLDVRADSSGHRVFYYIEDDDAEQYKIFSTRYIAPSGGFDDLHTSMRNPVPLPSNPFFNFPVRFRRIEIQLGSGGVTGATYLGNVYLDNFRVRYPAVITSVGDPGDRPGRFSLEQNYPNPFNPTTTIQFSIDNPQLTILKVFDVLGREVITLVNERLGPGKYTVQWDANAVASGVYFCSLRTGWGTLSKKLLLLK